ncbi:hypothetical protein SH584_06380 [Sphingomonas sp. LY29]|uniref:hypothetical protein n=1 Tax=Sphingomonas sp. LY29 TaxID=3095341 RepID=UPI002D76BF43|nr:hypothetical protein [Sphingomonas sp. LY29]WRP24698.1 hypothetical protein SH584_06380 [Sphingomonas sp. LY29]
MLKSLTLLAGAAFAVPALAQVAPADAKPAKPAKDPNAQICERIAETGSRLSSKKVCMTAAQWEAQRNSHRTDIERAQQNVGIKNGG